MGNDSLKKELTAGVFYTAIAKYGGIVVSFVVAAILARLLPPEYFGVIAISTVIINFFSIFGEMGIGPAIIQNQSLAKTDLSSIFSFTVYLGIAMGLLFFLCASSIASYYDESVLKSICQILSLNIFFATLSIVPNALLYKEKLFKLIAKRTLVLQLSGGIIAIIGALNGLGIYALLINPLIFSIGLFVISFYYRPQRFHWKFNISSLKLIYHFSIYQFMFNVINYFSRNLDKLMIGKFIGMSPLGYYEKSYRLMMMPLENITQVITPVMHPVFARFQNDLQQLMVNYLKIVRLLAFIGLPLSIFLFFSSKEIILIVFGKQWLGAVPVFSILSLSVGIQVILSSSGSMFQSANKTKILFFTGLVSAVANIGGLFIAIFIFKTLNAVAWALVIAFSFNFIQCYWLMFHKVFRQRFSLFFRTLISPFVVSLLIAVTLYIISLWTTDYHIIVSLIIKTLSYVILLAAYLQLKKEYDILGLIKNKLRKK